MIYPLFVHLPIYIMLEPLNLDIDSYIEKGFHQFYFESIFFYLYWIGDHT